MESLLNMRTCLIEAEVKRVAEQMREASTRYERIFTDLESQIFNAIVNLQDASETMAVCVEHIDRAIVAFQYHFPASATIACRKGCHHCCFFPIVCPPQVVRDSTRYLKSTLAESEIKELKRKLSGDNAQRNPPFHRARCPFLNDAHACSIYERRPLACRSFTSPDAGLCLQSRVDGRNIPQHPIHHRIYQAATTALLAAARKQGRFHKQLSFISSLLNALEEENDTANQVERAGAPGFQGPG